MPKFNETTAPVRTQNLAGGTAYAQNAPEELTSLLLTSFLGDKFYRTGTEELDHLRVLVAADPEFAAKAAVYARNEHGMRSVSHVVAGEVVEHVKGEGWVKDFIAAVIRRPDDMTEILAYRSGTYGLHPIPNSLKKGLRAAFNKYDSYQLGKYRAADKQISLVDVVNLVKPKPNERNAEALKALVDGTLRQTGTWEDRLSSGEDKTTVWRELINENALGYFALLRNLRNISEQADDETLALALHQLVDPERVSKSLVLPFRYLTAYRELSKPGAADYTRQSAILKALSAAADMSVSNLPDFEGTTLVALDVSGSMQMGRVSGSLTTVGEIGAMFAAALLRRLTGRCHFITFDTQSYQPVIDPGDSLLSVTQQIVHGMSGGGTNLDLAFAVTVPVDRVIILSDMQAWTNGEWRQGGYGWSFGTTGLAHRPAGNALNEYVKRTGANPEVIAVDLTGHGSLQFPRERCYQIAGWSEKMFTLMSMLEDDAHAMVNTINTVAFQ